MGGMEDVDLGKDRTHLIDFIYGKKDGADSVSPSVDTSIPLSERSSQATIKPKKEKVKAAKKPTKKVTCSSGTCICMLLLAIAAILFAAFLGHHLTKQEFEMMNHQASEPIVSCKNYTRTHKKPHQPIVNEEDADENDVVRQPTKEELALPKSITPVWYQVSLSPKAGGNGTGGVAMVKLNVTEATKQIVLNSKDIEFTKDLSKIQLLREAATRRKRSEEVTNATVVEGSGEHMEEEMTTTPAPTFIDSGIKVTEVQIDEDLEKAILTLDKELPQGSEIILQIPFVSKVSNNNGLKEYKYKAADGTEQSMFTTQPSYAYLRHVFPSFDQEAFKAPAGMTLMHSKGSVVVANTMVDTVDDGDSMTSTLKKTMDPDFVIGDLVKSEFNTTSGLTLRIWSRPEVKESTEKALDYATRALDALEHILQSRLETKTLDIVAVPGFQTGNRVSNAFIILPESDILYNENSNDISQRVRLARVIANKIAGQWFGGITNPTEYGTFWLNDALPKYLENEALEKMLNVDSDSLWTYEMEGILEKDATATSRPLRVKNVHSAADIASIDHEFIGDKGAAVLRMIEKSMGRDGFNKAIRSFVSSYRSSYPYDDGLWTSFEKALNGKVKGWNGEELNVGKFVNTWVDQIGFPVVSVEKLDDENVELSQERFKNDQKTPEQFKFRNAKYWFNWEVPLFLKSDGNVGNVSWLHEAFRVPLNTSDSILLNTDSNGLYRVNYEEKRWYQITKQLEEDHTKMSDKTRARLISDVFAFANSGVFPFEVALNVTKYLPKEEAVIPWLIATDKFKKLAERMEGSVIQDKIHTFIYDKISKKFDELVSSENEDNYLESLLRANLLELMSIVKPGASNEPLGQLFQNHFLEHCQDSGNYSSHCSQVPGDLRGKVYCNGVEFGNDTVFETIRMLAEKEIDGKEKDVLLEALACYRDPRSLRKLLLSNVNSTSTMVQLLNKMNSRPVGKEIATNFIIDNWTVLKKKFHNDLESLNEIVNAGVSLDNEREKSMIETFMDHHHKSTNGLTSLDKKIESATSDIYWRKQRANELSDYLDGKMKGPAKEEDNDSSEEEEGH